MKCLVSNPRKLRRIRARTGLDVVAACVRGGWGHFYFVTTRDGNRYRVCIRTWEVTDRVLQEPQ